MFPDLNNKRYTSLILFELQGSVRWYSQESKRPSFISRVLDNFRQEMSKNNEMKENLKKFREEAQKLENTDALKKAREKFQAVESEASKSSDVLKGGVNILKEKVQGVFDEAQKTEFAKTAGKITQGIGKSAKEAGETIAETSQKIKSTAAYNTLSNTAETVRKEIDFAGAQVYRYLSLLFLFRRLWCSFLLLQGQKGLFK